MKSFPTSSRSASSPQTTWTTYYNGSTYGNGDDTVKDWHDAAAITTAGPPTLMRVGNTIALGNGATLTCVASNGYIIGGKRVAVSNENDRSLAVLVQYRGFDWLWASDLGGGKGDKKCTGAGYRAG